ncbi:integrase [Pseudomonas putida]|nr:integrase [Pseudomonas putida]
MQASQGVVYSYLRFSDPRQAAGNSADRQAEYAKSWAAARGLTLDESLSLRDEGLSAFHQRHIKQGALGVFLQAVDEGRIPVGSVLVVEGLDRLSRAEPIQAQAQLAQIINAGITVVTASDGREYNRERLKAQPMDLVYSLLVMIRAHEESDTKSKRVKASIKRLCEGWIAGHYRGLIRNGSDPRWVRLVDGHWELIPERAEVVRFAIEKYREGHGADRAFSMMQERGFDTSYLGISPQQIYRLIKLVALKGAKQISVGGEDYLLEDYYPRLLSDAEFDELQLLRGQRSRRRRKGAIPGVVTGIGITYCGYCGTAMTAQNVMHKVRPDGTLTDGHRRIMCMSYMNKGGCDVGGSCSVAPVERAVMSFCSDQMNLLRLQQPIGPSGDLQQGVMSSRKQVVDLDAQLGRITEALALGEGDGVLPITFLRKARDLEEQLAAARVKLHQAERELAGIASRQRPADARLWSELTAGVEAQEVEARDKVRQLMIDTFDRIVIYMRGLVPEGRRAWYIDVLLISKAGQRRWLRVERKSGKWAAGVDRPD